MAWFIGWIVITALATAFVLFLCKKWGWLEWAQVHAPSDFLNNLLRCQFCTSFWTAWLLVIPAVLITEDLWLLAVPPLATIIACRLW